MKIHIPTLEKDTHFSELSPKDGKYKYRYTLQKSLIVFWEGYVPHRTRLSFQDEKNREWLYMDQNHFIIPKRYSWDGCTPKRHIPIFGWVGTPDFEETILASVIHDAFCQFQHTEHFPFSRKIIDNIFKFLMEEEYFVFADIYYSGVRFGSRFSKNNNKQKSIILDKSPH